MPAAREGAEVEWAVNHQTAQYTLPMTLNGDRKGEGWSRIVCQLVYDVVLIRSYNQDHCAVSIEAAGPLAHYDVATYNPPFTLKASPFQLRGLAAHVVNSCVKVSLDHRGRPREGTGGRGGFATHQIQNLADYVMVSDDLSNYPWNSTYFTVTIHTKGRDPPQAGNYDPSVAVLVAEYLKLKQRGTSRKVWTRLNNAINKFTMRTQNMHAGGRTAPWWGATAGMVEKMSYECDDKLMAPAEVDCAQVEWSELGPDDETVALGPTLSKVLGYNTCQLVITAAVTTIVQWRHIRVALDTLLNVCLANPIQRPTGGRAYVGPRLGISGGIWGRQLSNVSTNAWDGNFTGLDALPAGVNITVSAKPSG
ncbi:MAG: hypothetical protein HETSPECPRED_004722 [Heterodermia speciosa]|uniref:Uncharacterized protein n=1 Tax=Heterodermia speciosa TaxID=116794 RepID=A0A8H3I8U0_9LECA|nr:MAG: hypothetical protein HETSPECPRED_004722 [Heterodermia speciosa]